MSTHHSGYLAVLNCHHQIKYDPRPWVNDTLFCFRCNTFRLCVDVVKESRIHCYSSNCRTSRGFGADEGAARRFAIRHLRDHPGHVVWLCQGETPRVRIRDDQPTLPIRYQNVTLPGV